jgi:lactate dehydrogenase-like 2-hydroxyacid dehydrogenase
MSAPRLLLARRITPAAEDRARREFDALVADHDLDAAETIALAKQHKAEGLLIGSPCRLDAAAINALPDHVKVIANASVGYDHMDADAAKARGIIVTNTPDVLTDCTADLAFMLLLAACRRGYEYEKMMREGWGIRMGLADWLGVKPSGKTIGIVGMGRIGRAMAQRARGFGMKVIYHNRSRLPPELEQGAEYFADLNAMLPHSQILSLHLPAGGGTLMTRETFALLPKGAVFVNSARGALVDEDALIEALTNVFLTPHMASATQETRDAMGNLALDNLAAVCAGRPALTPV